MLGYYVCSKLRPHQLWNVWRSYVFEVLVNSVYIFFKLWRTSHIWTSWPSFVVNIILIQNNKVWLDHRQIVRVNSQSFVLGIRKCEHITAVFTIFICQMNFAFCKPSLVNVWVACILIFHFYRNSILKFSIWLFGLRNSKFAQFLRILFRLLPLFLAEFEGEQGF